MSFVKSGINSLKKNQFLRNVAVPTGGIAAAQVLLSFASMSILGQLYGSGLQDTYGIRVYITSTTQQVACFRYDCAIVVADSDEEAGGAFMLSALLTILFSALLGLITWPFIPQIDMRFYLMDGAESILWMIPLTTLICGLTTALNYFNIRCEKCKVISTSNIIRVSMMIATQLVLGYPGVGYWDIIIGQFLSCLFSNLRMAMTLKGRIHRYTFRLPFLKKIARKDVAYPKYMLPSVITNSPSINMTGLFVQTRFGGIINGYYSQINHLLGNSLTLVSNTVPQVFLRDASVDKHSGGKLSKTFSMVAKQLTILSILPFGFLLLRGDPTIPSFLGPEWRPTPEYLKYLIPLSTVRFVVTPLINGAIALGRQKVIMAWQSFLLLTVPIPPPLTFVTPMTLEQYSLTTPLPMAGAYLIFYRFCQTIVRSVE